MDFGVDWLAFGLIGVLLILFAETGLLVGFFLPGDTLLVAAGIATASGSDVRHPLSLPLLLVLAPVAAVAGAQVGYHLGARYGRRLFENRNARIFKPAYAERAEHYFTKFGPGWAVLLARFVPVVRTFMNPLAGMLEMRARRFLLWNVLGALLWTETIVLLGHFLGSKIKGIDKFVLPVVGLVVIVSVAPVLREVLRGRKNTGNPNDSEGSHPSLSGDSSR